MRKKIASMVVAITLFMGGGASAVYAATQYPYEGGRWDYGYNGFTLSMSSTYYHGYRCHTASVKHGVNRYSRSVATAAGYTATAFLGWVGPGDAKNYYYGVC